VVIVAEIGASHSRKLKNIIDLIDKVTEADAFKIQTWSSDSMAVKHKLQSGPWKDQQLQGLYKRAQLPWEMHQDVFDYCREKGTEVFSSPFDKASVDFLERFDCPKYKVASFELIDLGLVRHIASTGKPMILSTGQVTNDELEDILEVIEPINNQITLLHCVSNYPTDFSQVNLERLNYLKTFGFPVGISDHTPGAVVPTAATVMGATMIEKHIKLHDRGLDKSFAMSPGPFNSMARQVRSTIKALGARSVAIDTELRRSLYFAQDLTAGTVVQYRHLKTARPNKGLSPLLIDKVVGQKVAMNVLENDPVLLNG
jgi:N-acetylneuraminate synthase